MDTGKLVKKLEAYFDLSKKKRRKKHDKLLKIIKKLEAKKAEIETELIEQSKLDETSARYQELRQEMKIVSRLVKKAKQQESAD